MNRLVMNLMLSGFLVSGAFAQSDAERETLLKHAALALADARVLLEKSDYENAESACLVAVKGYAAAGIGGFGAYALMGEILYEQGFDGEAFKHIAQVYNWGRDSRIRGRVGLFLAITGSRIGRHHAAGATLQAYIFANSDRLAAFPVPEPDWPGLDTPVQLLCTALLFLALEPGRPVERSLRDLTAALNLMPQSPAINYALGITYQRANKPAEAIKHLQAAEARASGKLLELAKQRLAEARASG